MNANACILINTDLPTIAMGLYHIAATLKENHIPCHIHKFKDTGSLFNRIKKLNAGVAGFSLHWHSQLVPSIKLAEQIKCEFPDIIIVLGGLTASYFGKELIAFEQVDFVVMGDGEIPMLNIAQKIPSSQIPNIIWKTGENEIRSNPIQYETDVEKLRDFVYETHDDFVNTRSILKMGKGCFFKCFHCGGRNKAYADKGIEQPVFFSTKDVTHAVERNYNALKFNHLYLAQDHFRDIRQMTDGITALSDELDKKFSVNVSAWGLPAVDDIMKICRKVRGVCLEISIDSVDEALLAESRGYHFDEPVMDYIIRYLNELYLIPNIEIVLFFSYPHIHNDKMLFPDYDTLEAMLLLEDRFRRQHLESRLGLCYFLLSTDPGSLYCKGYSFERYWEELLAAQSGFGSFCFHYKAHMAENAFNAHHFFIQLLMKMFEHATNFFQYLYRVSYQSDIHTFYDDLFSVFQEIFQKEILQELQMRQSYADGYSCLGYSCIKQETISYPQLSNFIFRFVARCMDKKIINPEFAVIRYLFSPETGTSGTAYASCLDTARENAVTKPGNPAYPLKNALLKICRQTPNVTLIWAGALFGTGSAFRERKYEVLWNFFPHFSLRELQGACRANGNAFEALYALSKDFNPENKKTIEVIITHLIRQHGRSDLENCLNRILDGKNERMKTLPIHYAVSERTRKLIPLTTEEMFILDHCNGLNKMEKIADNFIKKFELDADIFDTVVTFFYLNDLLI